MPIHLTTSMPRFRICKWAAWAPGLPTREHWNRWLAAPDPSMLEGDAVPALAELPPMTRRRIDPLGRAALQVAFEAQGPDGTGPVVFASRRGEITRSVSLLRQLARGEPLSPTAFSLSVHNASSALYSIARGDTANYTAVSAGPSSAAAGFCEAIGLLVDGAPRVLVVSVESALPEPYQSFETESLPVRAWAALIEAGDEFGLQASPPPGSCEAGLPSDLATLQFLTGTTPDLHQCGWHWTRHA